MSGLDDWTAWALAGGVAALFAAYFAWVGRSLFASLRRLIDTIQNWPQLRRAIVEAEVRAGGRYPLWFRALRVTTLLALFGLVALLVWRKFA